MKPKIQIHPISRINFKTLKDFITDEQVPEEKMILLNQIDFDNLIIDHLNEYNSSMEFPFYYLGIEIDQDIYNIVRPKHVGIMNSEEFNQLY